MSNALGARGGSGTGLEQIQSGARLHWLGTLLGQKGRPTSSRYAGLATWMACGR